MAYARAQHNSLYGFVSIASFKKNSLYIHASHRQQWNNQHLCPPINFQVPSQNSHQNSVCDICQSSHSPVYIGELDDHLHINTPAIRFSFQPGPKEIDWGALEHANKEKYKADYCGEEGDDVCCDAMECHDASNAKKEEAGGNFCQRNGACIRKEAEPPALLTY
jgi:hypothetical protein